MQRRSQCIGSIKPSVSIQLFKEAMSNWHRPLFRRLGSSHALGHTRLNESRTQAAHQQLRMLLGQQHGVAAQQGFRQAVATHAVRWRAQSWLGMFCDLRPRDIWVAKHFLHVWGAPGNIHRAGTGADIHNAARLAKQRHEALNDSFRSKEVGVHHHIRGHTMAKSGSCIVHDGIELRALCQASFHIRHCRHHRFIWGGVQLHDFTLALAGCRFTIHNALHSCCSLF